MEISTRLFQHFPSPSRLWNGKETACWPEEGKETFNGLTKEPSGLREENKTLSGIWRVKRPPSWLESIKRPIADEGEKIGPSGLREKKEKPS